MHVLLFQYAFGFLVRIFPPMLKKKKNQKTSYINFRTCLGVRIIGFFPPLLTTIHYIFLPLMVITLFTISFITLYLKFFSFLYVSATFVSYIVRLRPPIITPGRSFQFPLDSLDVCLFGGCFSRWSTTFFLIIDSIFVRSITVAKSIL